MVSKEEARRMAYKDLRFNVGNLVFIYNEYSKGEEYYFEIGYYPIEVTEEKVRYYERQKVGETKVTNEGELKRNDVEEIRDRVGKFKDKAIQGEIDVYQEWERENTGDYELPESQEDF